MAGNERRIYDTIGSRVLALMDVAPRNEVKVEETWGILLFTGGGDITARTTRKIDVSRDGRKVSAVWSKEGIGANLDLVAKSGGYVSSVDSGGTSVRINFLVEGTGWTNVDRADMVLERVEGRPASQNGITRVWWYDLNDAMDGDDLLAKLNVINDVLRPMLDRTGQQL